MLHDLNRGAEAIPMEERAEKIRTLYEETQKR